MNKIILSFLTFLLIISFSNATTIFTIDPTIISGGYSNSHSWYVYLNTSDSNYTTITYTMVNASNTSQIISQVNSTALTQIFPMPYEGSYTLQMSVYGWDGNLGVNSTTINLDFNAPIVSILNDSTPDNYYSPWGNLFLDLSITDKNPTFNSYYLFNSNGSIYQNLSNTLWSTHNYLNLPDDNYTYYASISDLAGNIVTTPIQKATIQSGYPIINLNNEYSNASNINFFLNTTQQSTLNLTYWYDANNKTNSYNSTLANYREFTLPNLYCNTTYYYTINFTNIVGTYNAISNSSISTQDCYIGYNNTRPITNPPVLICGIDIQCNETNQTSNTTTLENTFATISPPDSTPTIRATPIESGIHAKIQALASPTPKPTTIPTIAPTQTCETNQSLCEPQTSTENPNAMWAWIIIGGLLGSVGVFFYFKD